MAGMVRHGERIVADLLKYVPIVSGTTSVTPETVTEINFSQKTHALMFDNRSSVANLHVSLDGGTTYKTLDPTEIWSIDFYGLDVLKLKSNSPSVPYEVAVGYMHSKPV